MTNSTILHSSLLCLCLFQTGECFYEQLVRRMVMLVLRTILMIIGAIVVISLIISLI